MTIAQTTVVGPVYMVNGQAPTEAKIIFELDGWDKQEGEAVFPKGPFVTAIDNTGNFTADLFTNTDGENRVGYRVYMTYLDGLGKYQREYFGQVTLSGPGPFQLSTLQFVNEELSKDPFTYDVYSELLAVYENMGNLNTSVEGKVQQIEDKVTETEAALTTMAEGSFSRRDYTQAELVNPITLTSSSGVRELVEVYFDGILQEVSNYSVSGDELTWTGGWPADHTLTTLIVRGPRDASAESAAMQAAIAEAEGFRDQAESFKNDTNTIKSETQTIKDDTAQLKTDVEGLKNDTGSIRDDAQQAADAAAQSAADAQAVVDNAGAGGIQNISEDATPELGGPLSTNGHMVSMSFGASVGGVTEDSDFVLDIGDDGNFFEVNTSGFITKIRNRPPGTEIKLFAKSSFYFNHNSSKLLLLPEKQFQVKSGDILEFTKLDSGDVWQQSGYLPDKGEALFAKPIVSNLGSFNYTSSIASITISNNMNGNLHYAYELDIMDMRVMSDNQRLELNLYASAYLSSSHVLRTWNSAGAVQNIVGSGQDIPLTGLNMKASGNIYDSYTGKVRVTGTKSGESCHIESKGSYIGTDGHVYNAEVQAIVNANLIYPLIRMYLLPSAGNIRSGQLRVLGYHR